MPDDLVEAELLALVAASLDHEQPVPADAVAVARAAFDLGSLDSDLLELTYDSFRDEALVALRSGAHRHRELSFEATSVLVDIEVLDDGRTIVGQIAPPNRGEVIVETPRGQTTAHSDELGRFRAEIEPGPFRVRVRSTAPVTVTPWITG
jgi:hypothetical protein